MAFWGKKFKIGVMEKKKEKRVKKEGKLHLKRGESP